MAPSENTPQKTASALSLVQIVFWGATSLPPYFFSVNYIQVLVRKTHSYVDARTGTRRKENVFNL